MSDERKIDRKDFEQVQTLGDDESSRGEKDYAEIKSSSPQLSSSEEQSGEDESGGSGSSRDLVKDKEGESSKVPEEQIERSRSHESEQEEGAPTTGGKTKPKGSEEKGEVTTREEEPPPLPKEPSLEEREAPPAEELVPRELYDELNDRFLRVAADFENYKRRIIKEKADIMAYGNERLIKELLTVVDNLERALKHSDSGENDSSVVAGIKLVHRQFLSLLEKFGVKAIDVAMGEEFDPRYHQAIEQVAASEITPGIILSEILRGYTLNDKLLRPALVAVSKPEEGDEENAQDNET